MSANLQAALRYAEQGYYVFPCHNVTPTGRCSCRKSDCRSIGKHPIPKNGAKDATRDPELIRRWWTDNPNANIAVATGHDKLFVLDIDTGDGKPGKENLKNLEQQFGPLPPTLRQITGSGGEHYFFDSDREVRNSTNRVSRAIDVRGIGGYVILPPSNHVSGNKYRWANSRTTIRSAPQWLVDLAVGEHIDPRQDKAQGFQKEDLVQKRKFSAEEVKSILKHIDSDERDVWFKVGAALLTEYGPKRGFELWEEWSSKSAKYDGEIQKQQWRSMRPGEITMGTIVAYARDAGWRGFDKEAVDSPEIIDAWMWVAST